jgi:replicative DNA helicase
VRHDVNAERAVLGSVLYSGGRALAGLELDPGDHYRPAHEQLHHLLLTMHAAGDPIEIPALLHRLASEAIPGVDAAYLHGLTEGVAVANVGYYARIIAGHARLRRTHAAALRIAQMTESADLDDIDSLIESLRHDLDIATRGRDASSATRLCDAWTRALERWETPDTDVLPTGWRDLDDVLAGGMRPGHLFVIGARPAVGKSIAAAVVATHVASRNTGVLFSSLEMSEAEVTDRIASNLARVNLSRLTERNVSDWELQRLVGAHARSSGWPLWIDDRPGVGVNAIRGRARDVSRRSEGLGLVVVDYLQLIAPTDRKAPRQEQVATISRSLKLLAREMCVPVVALAQLNRGLVHRQDKRPVMSDLRESGAIEADADEIVLLHRDEKERPGEIEFGVEKNRHGRETRVSLSWSPHHARIASLARYGEDDVA